jgi:hypothetical protein
VKDSAIHFQKTPTKKEKGKNMFTIISALYSKIIYVPTVPYFARSSGWIRIPVALRVTPSIKKKNIFDDRRQHSVAVTHTRTLLEYIYEKSLFEYLWIL